MLPSKPVFPYPSFRPGQREVAESVAKTVEKGGVLALQAPTGYGKTAAVIYGLLLGGAERVLYVVRTRNEIVPVVRELHRFGARYTFLFSARKMCPLLRPSEGELESGIEDFWENCRLARLSGACDYYANLESANAGLIASLVRDAGEDAYAAVAMLTSYHLCPFFALRMLLEESVFVVATYPYLFNPDIFVGTFEPRGYEDFVVVVDEAHSLMEAYTMLERTVSERDIVQALREVEEHYGREVAAYDALIELRNVLRNTRLNRDELVRADRAKIAKILGDPEEWEDMALEIRLEKLKKLLDEGRAANIKIALTKIALFAEAAAREDYRVYVEAGEDARVKAIPVDNCVVTREPLNSSKAAILMSGTMPPLSYIRDVLCVQKPISAYDVELIHGVGVGGKRSKYTIVAAELSSKYTSRGAYMYKLYASYIEAVWRITGKTVLAVYPSYEFMRSIVALLDVERDSLVVEDKKTTVSEVLEVLRERGRILINAVAGGKLVEGVEYLGANGRSLVNVVFIAGVPYPQPDAILEDFIASLAKRVGAQQARDYVFNVTAVVKVKQAMGRAIRSPSDKALYVLGDYRFLARRLRELMKTRYDRVVSSINQFEDALRAAMVELWGSEA